MILEKIKKNLLFFQKNTKRSSFATMLGLIAAILFLFIGLGPFSLLLGLLVFVGAFSVNCSLFVLLILIVVKHQLRYLDFFPEQFITLVIPVVLLVAVISEFLYGQRKLKISKSDYFLFFFVVFSLPATVLFSYVYGFSKFQVLDFFVFAQAIGFYLLGRLLTKKSMLIGAKFNYLIALLVSLHGIVQYFISYNFYPWLESFESVAFRSYGILGNPNAFSGYLLMSIFFSLLFLKKKTDYILLLPLFTGIILSHSRGVLVALLVSLAFFVFMHLKGTKFIHFAVPGLVLFFLGASQLAPRMASLNNPDFLFNSLASGRLWAIKNVLYINSQSFFSRFFGNGWGSYGGEYAYGGLSGVYLRGVQGGAVGVPNTDNQWLQIYAQQGLLGVLFLFVFFLATFINNLNRSRLSYAVLSGMVLMVFIDLIQFYQIGALLFLMTGILNSKDIDLPK